MSVAHFPLSGEEQEIHASPDDRKLVAPGAGELEIRVKDKFADLSESTKIERAVTVRGYGRVFVTDLDPHEPGNHPNVNVPTTPKAKPAKKASKK